MSTKENYTTINSNDVAQYGLDQELLGKTVTASEYKKLTGMDKTPLPQETTPSVTEGADGTGEGADVAETPKKKGKK